MRRVQNSLIEQHYHYSDQKFQSSQFADSSSFQLAVFSFPQLHSLAFSSITADLLIISFFSLTCSSIAFQGSLCNGFKLSVHYISWNWRNGSQVSCKMGVDPFQDSEWRTFFWVGHKPSFDEHLALYWFSAGLYGICSFHGMEGRARRRRQK